MPVFSLSLAVHAPEPARACRSCRPACGAWAVCLAAFQRWLRLRLGRGLGLSGCGLSALQAQEQARVSVTTLEQRLALHHRGSRLLGVQMLAEALLCLRAGIGL